MYFVNEKTEGGGISIPNNLSRDLSNCKPGDHSYFKMNGIVLDVTVIGIETWRQKQVCHSSSILTGRDGEKFNMDVYRIENENECIVTSSLTNASDNYTECEGDWRTY